jgi:hypothetical protein
MITITLPKSDGKGIALPLQPIDAGDKFTGITAYAVAHNDSPEPPFTGQAGLMNVEMSSNTNNAGETRVLVKVNLPFYAHKSMSCGCDGTSVPSFAKSGTIGAHVVITLPRGFTKDYVASNTTWTARRQLNAVLGALFSALYGTTTDRDTPVNDLVSVTDGHLLGSCYDPLGLYSPDGVINRAVMGLRPAAPDKTYGSKTIA